MAHATRPEEHAVRRLVEQVWTATCADATWAGATFASFDAKGRISEVWSVETS
jgi:hypothetical protein